jgi:hypothetical protein
MSIYVATHKKVELPKCNWLIPIGLSGYKDEQVVISDSISQNNSQISFKNKNYCELTGLYWLWKNCEDDYIGLCHYRRYFSFLHYSGNGDNYPSFLNLSDETGFFDFISSETQHNMLLGIINTYDFIIPRPIIHPETVATAFVSAHGKKIWQIFLNKCQIEFGFDLRYFDFETRFYYGNMLVANKYNFQKYCSTLFQVIDSVFEEVGDLPHEPGLRYQLFRYPGYLAERFLGLYLYKTRPTAFEAPTIWLNT